MFIITIDCGTTNTRLYLVDENGNLISAVSRKIGVSDVAVYSSTDILKSELKQMFDQILLNSGIGIKDIKFIIASGVITSEIGLFELEHLWTPCTLSDIAENIKNVGNLGVFPEEIPVYFIRGVKNYFDPDTAFINDIGMIDTLRGEETQIIGLLTTIDIELPVIIIMLSSHTKIIPVDKDSRILKSITTFSGQLYEVISQNTVLKKSIKKTDDLDGTKNTAIEIINTAYNEVRKSGFLRGLMCIRYLDILAHANGTECKLFMESLFAADDLLAIKNLQYSLELPISNFILIGNKFRCSIYKYILQEKMDKECTVSIITNKSKIDKLSILGALAIAKRARIL